MKLILKRPYVLALPRVSPCISVFGDSATTKRRPPHPVADATNRMCRHRPLETQLYALEKLGQFASDFTQTSSTAGGRVWTTKTTSSTRNNTLLTGYVDQVTSGTRRPALRALSLQAPATGAWPHPGHENHRIFSHLLTLLVSTVSSLLHRISSYLMKLIQEATFQVCVLKWDSVFQWAASFFSFFCIN